MNTFFSCSILIHNTVAEYEIFQRGERYKALLVLSESCDHLPLEFSLWKEKGQWRSNQFINEHVLYQFGYLIDNFILSSALAEIKLRAA